MDWKPPEAKVPPGSQLAMPGGTFGGHDLGGLAGVSWLETRDAATGPTMRRTGSQASSAKCEQG